VSLFIAGEAFSDTVTTGAAKMGAMLSLSAAIGAILLGKLLGVVKKS
jgi:hypothetical protein